MRELLILLMLALAAQSAQEPSSPSSASTLDYAFFRDRVQPIFLAKRPGHARCIVCHDHGSPRLEDLNENGFVMIPEDR